MFGLTEQKRFKDRQIDTRGDYSGSRPGAFDKSTADVKGGRAMSTMGGMSRRSSVFDAKAEESASLFGAYNIEATGAFSKVAAKGSGSSAAFASKSGRFDKAAPQPTCSASYDTSYNTMGAIAARSACKTSGGTFGSTRRDFAMGVNSKATPRGSDADDGVRSDEVAAVPSSFGGVNRHNKGPSAAFGGSKDRFASTKAATPGPGEYTAERKPLQQSRSGNGISSRGTMGTTDRFAPVKEAAPGDYSDAKPSAFSKSKSHSRLANTGFGGTVSRVTAFEKQAAQAMRNAPSTDSTYTAPGAFADAQAIKASGPSSGFASRSERMPAGKVADGPAPGTYGAANASSFASKSFSKSSRLGSGGFGSSVKRTGLELRASEAPGPGEYDASAASFGRVDAKPSAAFASRSEKQPSYLKPSTQTEDAADYDPYANDGMGAAAGKTFNRTAKGTMGSSSRFAPTKEAAPDVQYEVPSAFEKSKSSMGYANTGFGGSAPRTTAFDEVQKAAIDAAPDRDSYYVAPGAFAKANEASGPSSGFASKSERMPASKGGDAPAPGAYGVTNEAMGVHKSFNKSAAAGEGGFGSSMKRTGLELRTDVEDYPAPGAYDAASADALGRVDTRPSSAFASKSNKHDSYVPKAAGNTNAMSYDAHAKDGIGIVKSFNVKAGTGNFGPKVQRKTHEIKDTPGAGDYAPADPSRPTVDKDVNSTRGRVTGPFASTSLRDTSQWAGGV